MRLFIQTRSSNAAQAMKSRSRCSKCAAGASPPTALDSREETRHCGDACEGHSSASPPAPSPLLSSAFPSPFHPQVVLGRVPGVAAHSPCFGHHGRSGQGERPRCQLPITQALLSSPPDCPALVSLPQSLPNLTLFTPILPPADRRSTHLSPQMNNRR